MARHEIVRLIAASVLVGVPAGLGLCWALDDSDSPSCPTEDSCQPVYEDGEWRIVEVAP